jgi:hypothetical protein
VTGLAWRLAFTGGWGRSALLAGCTAVVSGLLLVAVAVLSLPSSPQEALFNVVADPGTRGGYAFGTLLLAVPPLLLLHQAVRLGTTARERRLAALRLAGATPGEVRLIGAVEVGVPAFVGAVGGLAVYGVLRSLFGGSPIDPGIAGPGVIVTRSGGWPPGLVPTSVTPAWWELLAVVVLVTLAGIGVGLLAGRRVVVTPFGLTRRTRTTPPRPWGLVPILGALLFGGLSVNAYGESELLDTLAPLLALGLLVLGMVQLPPWVAHRVGIAVGRRTAVPERLLAARRLAAEPRPTGRAAAAVGGIGMVAGGCAAFLAGLLGDASISDPQHYAALALVGAGLVVGMVAVVGSLGVHSIESLVAQRRSTAALHVLGTPVELLRDALRWEARLVALPMGLGGTLFGALVLGVVASGYGAGYWSWWLVCTGTVLLAVAGLITLAIAAAGRITRPWLDRTLRTANLRTE